MKVDFLALFNRVISVIFSLMIVIILLTLVVGVWGLFVDIYHLVVEHKLRVDYLNIIYDVLTLFVMIELLRSIAEYFNSRRLRMTFIADAAIVFVLREIMIQIFEHKVVPAEMYALSALIVALTLLRVGSMLMHQRGTRLGDAP
jgi:uncharacterized membrane protein (DUF373 family)